MSVTEQKEIRLAKNTALTLIILLVSNIGGSAWYLAQLSSSVQQNTATIAQLEIDLSNTSSVNISRQQLEDILSLRDEQIANLQQSLQRIESKLDRMN